MLTLSCRFSSAIGSGSERSSSSSSSSSSLVEWRGCSFRRYVVYDLGEVSFILDEDLDAAVSIWFTCDFSSFLILPCLLKSGFIVSVKSEESWFFLDEVKHVILLVLIAAMCLGSA